MLCCCESPQPPLSEVQVESKEFAVFSNNLEESLRQSSPVCTRQPSVASKPPSLPPPKPPTPEPPRAPTPPPPPRAPTPPPRAPTPPPVKEEKVPEPEPEKEPEDLIPAIEEISMQLVPEEPITLLPLEEIDALPPPEEESEDPENDVRKYTGAIERGGKLKQSKYGLQVYKKTARGMKSIEIKPANATDKR